MTDGLNNSTSYGYATHSISSNNVIASQVDEVDTDPLTNTVTTTNNFARQPVNVIDKRGNATSYVYDVSNVDGLAQRNLLSTTNSLGKVSTYQYDANYNQTNSVDPLGHQAITLYDNSHRLISSKNGLGQIVAVNSYTAQGQLASTVDGAGDTNTFS